jgi:hypothetical protein
MNAQHAHHQAGFGEPAQQIATSTPIARFVPTAAAVADQTVEQWVEQELQRGRCRVRAGLAMLACLAVVAIPLVFLVG